MTDAEFWAALYPDDPELDIDPYEGEPGPVDIAPCVVCGSTDFCGYDQEGRPWIHADCAGDDDE